MVNSVAIRLGTGVVWILVLVTLVARAASAQTPSTVTTDNSTNTAVSGSPFSVTEGALRTNGSAATLFHSFDTFSPASSDVVFDLRETQNAVDTRLVNLILGRVTGGSGSFIDGALSIKRDSGTPVPDLLLINPNGIVLGANSRLDLPGSFLASTASGAIFAAGQVFSATDSAPLPMLTVSTPIGLQFASGAGDIIVRGRGHEVATTNPLLRPYSQVGANAGLSVEPKKTLALIGANVTLEGGVLNAPDGQLFVMGTQSGRSALTWEEGALFVSSAGGEQLGDVVFKGAAIANTSGTAAGTIQVQGRNIELSEGSLLWSQNRGLAEGGTISVAASDQLTVSGHTPTFSAFSSIASETVGAGAAGGIDVAAESITVRNGGTITNRTFGPGDGQGLMLSSESLSIDGTFSVIPSLFSTVGTVGFSTGKAGDVVGTLGDTVITEGGYLGSTSFGSGGSGDIRLTADDVVINGTTPLGISSLISSTTLGPEGNSGDLSLAVRSLTIQDSGVVTTSSASKGDAGDLQVAASDFISISGQKPGLRSSTIASTIDNPLPAIQQALGLSSAAQGDAGSVTIQTPLLNIFDSATVTVANLVEGNAGRITIDAGAIEVRSAAVDAFTAVGEGGNVFINAQDNIFLRNGQIRATSQGEGNGGNITIQSPVILGVEDSNIVANAVTGDGGNIDITTREILGLAFRAQQTPESDITASSEFGVSGTVSISGFSADVGARLVNLPTEVTDESDRIAKGCGESEGSQFIASGQGGLSLSPAEGIPVVRIWQDVRELRQRPDVVQPSVVLTERADTERANAERADTERANTAPPLIEATGFERSKGEIMLVAAEQSAVRSQPVCGDLH